MSHKIIAENTFFQLLTKGISTLSGFLITILLAHSLGERGYGDFTKVITLVGFFYLVIDFGLNAIYIQQDREETHFSAFVSLRLIIAVLLALFVNGVTFLLPHQGANGYPPLLYSSMFVFSVTLLSQAVMLSANALFQKQHKYRLGTYAAIIGSVLNLLLVFWFTMHQFSLALIMTAFLLSSMVTALIAFFLTKKPFRFSYDSRFSQQLLRSAWPVGLMLILNLIYFRADIFLLSLLKSTQDVGVYGLSYRFFDFLLAIPLFLSNALYPFLLAEKDNPEKFKALIARYLWVFLAGSFVCGILFWFASPLFILIKNDFAASILPFRILLVTLPVFFLTSFLQWILIALGRQKFLLGVYAGSAFLNITLNILLIPRYSYLASAALTGITEGFVLVLLFGTVYNAVYHDNYPQNLH